MLLKKQTQLLDQRIAWHDLFSPVVMEQGSTRATLFTPSWLSCDENRVPHVLLAVRLRRRLRSKPDTIRLLQDKHP